MNHMSSIGETKFTVFAVEYSVGHRIPPHRLVNTRSFVRKIGWLLCFVMLDSSIAGEYFLLEDIQFLQDIQPRQLLRYQASTHRESEIEKMTRLPETLHGAGIIDSSMKRRLSPVEETLMLRSVTLTLVCLPVRLPAHSPACLFANWLARFSERTTHEVNWDHHDSSSNLNNIYRWHGTSSAGSSSSSGPETQFCQGIRRDRRKK